VAGISKKAYWLISAGLILALLVAVEKTVGWRELFTPWQLIQPSLLALAILLVFTSYLIRSVRLYDYFSDDMRGYFPQVFKLMLQHNLANNLLPMRSGELSFPLLMSQYFRIPLSRSGPALLWLRVLDLHILGFLALGSISGSLGHPAYPVLLGLIWLLLPLVLFLANQLLLQRLSGHEDGGWRGVLKKILNGAPRHRGQLLRIWGWTLLNWCLKLAAFAWLLSLFAKLDARAALAGVIGGEITSVLPVHGVAGLGTYEAGIVAALLPFDAPTAAALAGAVNLHLFLLGLTLLGGGISLLIRSHHGD
jgi:uncharacterized membrane protein YbhN (UPF0104 family)